MPKRSSERERVIPFVKMHGARNDYVIIDLRSARPLSDPESLAISMSDRHTGVGADGLILIEAENGVGGRMVMYNSDGSRGEMCGNGLRCVSLLLSSGEPRNGLLVETDRGLLTADVLNESLPGGRMVRLEMGAPICNADDIPSELPGQPPLQVGLTVLKRAIDVSAVSMGNPHAVLIVDEILDDEFMTIAPALERHAAFPNGTNVEFVRVDSADRIRMRVWERGSGETQACGTGACAAVVVGRLLGLLGPEVRVHVSGGELRVLWDGPPSPVFLIGPAQEVFRGQWRLN